MELILLCYQYCSYSQQVKYDERLLWKRKPHFQSSNLWNYSYGHLKFVASKPLNTDVGEQN